MMFDAYAACGAGLHHWLRLMPLKTSRPVHIMRREAQPEALAALRTATSLTPLQQRVFAQRGVTDPAELELTLEQLLPVDAFPACAAAAQLLHEVMQAEQKILLVGDYDADGATGVAVAMRCLRAMGHKAVEYLVPNRFRHGYGMCVELLEEIESRQPQLIVTIDNGMSSQTAIAEARQRGMRVLVTDHHVPGAVLPEADCIVNPISPEGSFPSSALSGVGVIFYVMLALRRRLQQEGWFEQRKLEPPNMAQFLDLVALGTIADVVPLDLNNRILVEQGLRRIRKGKSVFGIHAMLRNAHRDPRHVSSTDLAFVVAPRINAAGRMEDISIGIQCLLADERVEAYLLAEQLEHINAQRRQQSAVTEAEASREARSLKPDTSDILTLCLHRTHWHEGISGIIAARIREEYGLPAIVFASGQDGLLKGSGRSVDGLHLRDVLVRVDQLQPGLMHRYGGHAMAVGITLPKENFERFRETFEQATAAELKGQRPEHRIETDGELDFDDLTLENAEFSRYGHPWGKDFAPPAFEGEFEVQDYEIFKDAHARFRLSPVGQSGRHIKAMAFSYQRLGWEPDSKRLRLVYQLDVDDFQGQRACMLNVQHIEVL